MNIAITLTSSLNVDQTYIDLTKTVAKYLANSGHGIVYGGTDYGMMSELAKSYKQAGGKKLTGVMARDLMQVTKAYEAYKDLDESITVDDMNQRKHKIFDLSDGVLVLPGGWGTIDEFVTVASEKINKISDKPIAIYNHHGFYNTLIEFMDELEGKRFTKIKFSEVVYVSDDLSKIEEYFSSYNKPILADKFVD